MKNKHVDILTTVLLVALPTLATLTAIKYLDIYYPVRITQSQAADFVITGEGSVDVTPDTAFVDVGITVSGVANVQDVERQINDANNKIVEAVKGLGVEAKDIKTTNYNVYPQQDIKPTDTAPRISGYSGNANLSITVRDKDKAPQVVQAATGAGANQVGGIRYSVENVDEFRKQARDEAIENAQQQAKELADKLGIRLGRVTNVVEGMSPQPMPIFANRNMTMDAMGAGGAAPELQAGSQTISTNVTLYFEKK